MWEYLKDMNFIFEILKKKKIPTDVVFNLKYNHEMKSIELYIWNFDVVIH